MKKVLIILIIACIPFGCKNRKTWGEEKWTGSEYRLESEEINVGETIFTESDLIFLGKYVIFENFDGNKFFSVFEWSADSLKSVGSFLTRGNGPFEANAVNLFFLDREQALVVVACNPRGKSFVIPMDDVKNVFDFSTWRTVDYPYVKSFAYNMLPMADSIYLMQSFGESDDLLRLLNTSGGRISGVGFPYPGHDDGITCNNKSEIYAGDIRKRPSGNRVVYSNSNSKYVEIFTLDDTVVTERVGLFNQMPVCVQRQDGSYRIVDNNESGYQLSVSDAYIYCADPKIDYSDRDRSIQRNGYPAGYVTDIYLSDWEGNPVCKYILDRPVCYLQPDPSDEYLYAFYLDSVSYEPGMVRFKLPDIH